MKKILKITFFLLLVFMIMSCAQKSLSPYEIKDNSLTEKGFNYYAVSSIPELDGTVSSDMKSDNSEQLIKIGKEKKSIYSIVHSKGVLTFDTSGFPTGKIITQVYIRLWSDNWFACGGSELQDWDSGKNSLAVEFAGQFGFGGNSYYPSFEISSSDYYSIGTGSGVMKSSIFEDSFMIADKAAGFNTNLIQYLNLKGKTQMRIKQNSSINANCSVHIYSGESSTATKPALFIVFE